MNRNAAGSNRRRWEHAGANNRRLGDNRNRIPQHVYHILGHTRQIDAKLHERSIRLHVMRRHPGRLHRHAAPPHEPLDPRLVALQRKRLHIIHHRRFRRRQYKYHHIDNHIMASARLHPEAVLDAKE